MSEGFTFLKVMFHRRNTGWQRQIKLMHIEARLHPKDVGAFILKSQNDEKNFYDFIYVF